MKSKKELEDSNIIENISKSMCLIEIKKEGEEIKYLGFFIKVFKELKFLITNSEAITQKMKESEDTITLKLIGKNMTVRIELNKLRKFFIINESFERETLIEIFDDDEGIESVLFIEVDKDFGSDKDCLNKYIKIIVLQDEENKENKKIKINNGIIEGIDKEYDYIFYQNIKINNFFSKINLTGSPIISISNGNHTKIKAVGFFYTGEKRQKENYGIFLSHIIRKTKMKKIEFPDGTKYYGEVKKINEKKNKEKEKNKHKTKEKEKEKEKNKEVIKEGNGTEIYPNGAKYIGGYKNNIFEGKGKFFFPSGAKYFGDYKNGKKDGQGEFYFKNGTKYIGDFKEDIIEGKGTHFFLNGEKYIGNWKNGKREGQGSYFYSNGEKYIGEFKNDKREGHGVYYYLNGDTDEGEWIDGEIQKDITNFTKDITFLTKDFTKDITNKTKDCNIF